MTDLLRLLVCAAGIVWTTSATVAQERTQGTRTDLSACLGLDAPEAGRQVQMFIPAHAPEASHESIPLIVHFHSAAWAVERALTESGIRAVLITVHLGPLSSPYRTFFEDSTSFARLLACVDSVLDARCRVRWGRLVLTSFSAGYAAVREILKNDGYFRRVDGILLADGLHTDDDEPTMRRQMEDFCRFARAAAEGEKVFVVTHSSIPTEGYRSTTQTTDYLLQCVRADRTGQTGEDVIGTMTSACSAGCFLLRGYAGESAADHMKHLHGMHIGLRALFSMLDSGCGHQH